MSSSSLRAPLVLLALSLGAFLCFRGSPQETIPVQSSLRAVEPSEQQEMARRLVLLGNYISGDYKVAVNDEAQVTNEDEYAEMLEFSKVIKELYLGEGLKDPQIVEKMDLLAQQIREKAKPQLVKESAKSLVKSLKESHELAASLGALPSFKKGKSLYEGYCASCHNLNGDAKTPLAGTMEPPPRDLIEEEFYADLSPARVHNTLKLGIDGTSMISYENILSEEDKWSVSFYVASLPFLKASYPKTKALQSMVAQAGSSLTWSRIADMSSSQLWAFLYKDLGLTGNEQKQVFSELRRGAFDPTLMALVGDGSAPLKEPRSFTDGREALAYTRQQMKELAEDLGEKQVSDLSGKLLDVYLEGFEFFERELKILAPEKLIPLEKKFMAMREQAREGASQERIKEALLALDEELGSLERLFLARKQGDGLSVFSDVMSSITIIVREGLEAFLIVMALLALVQNLGVRHAKRWIHSAWISAVVLGFLTYFLMNQVFEMSGASREVMEAALTGVAVVMLFYTGFWLLSQSNSQKWNHFVKGESKNKLAQGDLLTFFGLAFVAVYREAAETVLFYGALLNTAQSKSMVILGFFIGVFFLLCLCLAMLYYNVKIPLNKFFKVTSSLMFLLSFVLMGKAVYEIIESGYLVGTYLEKFPRLEALGLYPFAETLLAQGVLLGVTFFVLRRHHKNQEREGAEKSTEAKPLKA